MDAAVQEGKQVIRHDSLDAIVVTEFQAHPQAIELGSRQKYLTFRFEIIDEFSHEVNTPNILDVKIAVFPAGG